MTGSETRGSIKGNRSPFLELNIFESVLACMSSIHVLFVRICLYMSLCYIYDCMHSPKEEEERWGSR